jgi:hypothetical protein
MHKTLYVLGYAVVALLAGALIALYQLALMPDVTYHAVGTGGFDDTGDCSGGATNDDIDGAV